MHVALVHVIALVVNVVSLMLVLIARVIVHAVVVEFPWPVFCIRRYTLYTIKSNSVGSGYVLHRWTSSFNYHFDHGFVVIKDAQLILILRRMCVCGCVVHIIQLINLLPSFDIWVLGFGIKSRTSFLDAGMIGLDSVVG